MNEPEHEEYEVEFTPRGPAAGWVVLLLICVAMLAWGLAIFHFVPDVPRRWDFGTRPDVPGESIYSTQTTPPATPAAPAQLTPLPKADVATETTLTGPTTRPVAPEGARP
ncbi:MAG: hypothetical protein NT031_06055 [Planctomycetota bacterium]|nr:hypothetical protein [Planctomycetota bacterium]